MSSKVGMDYRKFILQPGGSMVSLLIYKWKGEGVTQVRVMKTPRRTYGGPG